MRVDLRRTNDAPREARRIVSDVLQRSGASEAQTDVARLLTTELVTNAVRHGAGGCIHLELQTNADLHVRVRNEVHGGGFRFGPATRMPPPAESAGRGLPLVAMLADRWGLECEPEAAKVWFSLRLDRRALHR